jgi:hypothetical protein
MLYHFLADLVVLIHATFIAFVVGGGFLAWRWRRLVWIHVPAALWGLVIELTGWICPLTPWEVALRRAAGQAGYAGGFIEHYLIPLIYPAGLTRTLQFELAALVLALNVVAYGRFIRKARQAPR